MGVFRKEDEVHVMRGKYKGAEGKILKVYRKKYMVYVDRITREKANGTKVTVGIHPSNVCAQVLACSGLQ